MRFLVKELGICAVIIIIISLYVSPTIVSGRSMAPNFSDSDYLLVSKTAYQRELPARGDVILFESNIKSEDGTKKTLIKRVIGLPGEEVSIHDGMVHINGKQLVDTVSLDGETFAEMGTVIVPENCFFCLGDNRANSTDSRFESVGCIELEDILGKVIFRLYPISSIGLIDSQV